MEYPTSKSVVTLVLEWLQLTSRSLTEGELEEWGVPKDFAESPEWDSAFGSLREATTFEIVEQMADINEALSSALRVRDKGFDWFVSYENESFSVESRKVDRREAAIMVEVFTARLEVLSGYLGG